MSLSGFAIRVIQELIKSELGSVPLLFLGSFCLELGYWISTAA